MDKGIEGRKVYQEGIEDVVQEASLAKAVGQMYPNQLLLLILLRGMFSG